MNGEEIKQEDRLEGSGGGMSGRSRPAEDAMAGIHAGRRLLGYALFYKKTILLALFMLSLAVSAELTGYVLPRLLARS